MDFEVKIGLEVHIQLNTKTKLFCNCRNEITKEPNKNVCEICLGFPGSKPFLNKKALEFAMKIAIALGMEIARKIYFSRKTYFYPDMAKNFQITQHDCFLATNGKLEILPGRRIRIRELHLEEDPARLYYPTKNIENAPYTLVDYGRAGVPLVEIVTEPDLKSPREARLFLQKLQQLLEFLYVSDFSKEGAMRVDANISILKFSGEYSFDGGYKEKTEEGSRVEIKNISGARNVEKALAYEILRQKHEKVEKQETRLWDENARITKPLRVKETKEDYGYIPEPDLPSFEITDELIEKVKKALPELPEMKKRRWEKLGIKEELIEGLLSDPELSHYFDYLCPYYDPKFVANFLVKYLKKSLNYHNLKLKDTFVSLHLLRQLLDKVVNGELLYQHAELVVRKLVELDRKEDSIDKIIEELKLPKVVSEEKLLQFINETLKENWKVVEDFRGGNEKAIDYLVGQVIKKAKGGADPKKVKELILKFI